MKKISIALVAFAAAIFSACQGGAGEKGPKPELANDVDTICYVIGNLNGKQMKTQIFSEAGMGIDSAYIKEFVKGLKEGVGMKANAKKKAYLAGVSMGFEMNNYLDKAIKSELYGRDDSTHTMNTKDFLAGLVAAIMDKPSLVEGEEFMLQGMIREKMSRISEAVKAEKNAGYKKQNDEYLKNIAKKDGVKELGDGIYYEVVTEGNGAIATVEQQVKVHYEGKTIDDNVFDSSYDRGEPIELMPTQVIPGWTKALTSMPVGSKWIVYIPYDQGYGEDGYGPIKGFSTLIFTIEVLEIIEN